MNYAILNNGVLEYAPVNYKTSNGNLIVNFNKNVVLMKKYGYKEVINQTPPYNEETEYIVISGYTETENNIQIIYEVKQKEVEDSIFDKINNLTEKLVKIEEVNNTQDTLIDITMLATDEIYTMIEPILDLVPQNLSLERGVSKMVDMYVCMVQRGLKTIEQIPIRYREEVRRILEELEK